jgi:hypothetical protein
VREIDDALDIAEGLFAAREIEWLRLVSPESCPLAFLALWTRKEASTGGTTRPASVTSMRVPPIRALRLHGDCEDMPPAEYEAAYWADHQGHGLTDSGVEGSIQSSVLLRPRQARVAAPRTSARPSSGPRSR